MQFHEMKSKIFTKFRYEFKVAYSW